MESGDRDWHVLSPAEACAALGTDAAHGLSDEQARRRLARHGANTLPDAARSSAWGVFLRQFQSPLIYILFAAAVLAFVLGERGDAVVILVVVLVNALIGSFQERRAERSMVALRQLSTLRCDVMRDGCSVRIEAQAVVPGDIVLVGAGDAVAADARVLDGQSLQALEAALTGESLSVTKQARALPADTLLADRSNMLYAGTHVVHGRGRAVVVATGSGTAVGDIARMTATAQSPKTPLEQRIDRFGRRLVLAAIVLFAAVMAIGTARGFPLVDIVLVAISQMVSMVPEGLPVAMTVALAVGMQRMAGRGAIVRRLAAVETLGSTSVICTDKTGTLTRNEMTVTALWLPDGRELKVTGSGYSPQGEVMIDGHAVTAVSDAVIASLAQAAVLCNDAQLKPPRGTGKDWIGVGDPTEIALLAFAAKTGLDVADVRESMPRGAEIPFDADTKMMATQHRSADGLHRVVIKGAPEAVIGLCGAWLDRAGRVTMDEEGVARAQTAVTALADRALRVLALAEVVDADAGELDGLARLAGRATLIGLAGEMDPPRNEAARAIANCTGAGIRTVMVTGDHKATGLAIARSLGIASADQRAVDSRELDALSDTDLRAGLDEIAVFARVHPAQKLRIVDAFGSCDNVVAMTGDGVNDAPALARADVGVAMGITGTEVAKSAADIVITDDNFATIVGAVHEGRLVYRNLKKVILYLIATSMAEIVVLLTALLFGYPLPLAAVQILWINIVTEGTVTVNLIMDPPQGDEMSIPPVSLAEPLVSRRLLKRIALMTPTMAASTLSYFIWHLGAGLPFGQVQTETFTVLAACQWFNVLNCQSETRSAFGPGLIRNPWLAAGLVLGVALQLMVVYWPAMNVLFHTTPIPAGSYPAILAAASLVLWVEEIRKWSVRRADHGPKRRD